MTEQEIVRLVRKTIMMELAPILMGSVVSNETQSRNTVQRVASEGTISNVRVVQPYGFSSRAPAGTTTTIVPVQHDPTNLMTIGNFDEQRTVTEDGEVALYNQFGQIIYLSDGKIQVGSKAADENLVLGKVFKQWAHDLLTQLSLETHIGNLGYLTSVPQNSVQYDALKASPIDDELILSDVSFTEKGS